MRSEVLTVERYETLIMRDVPNGAYEGTWVAYEVTSTIYGQRYRFRTNKGIRTTEAPCIVYVEDGCVSVDTNLKGG